MHAAALLLALVPLFVGNLGDPTWRVRDRSSAALYHLLPLAVPALEAAEGDKLNPERAHNDYPPYEARSGTDRTKPGAKKWVQGWTWGYVNANGSPTIDEIRAALYLYGRLNIALDAGGQFGNGTTTITQLGDGIDHEINCCGWDDNRDNGDGSKGRRARFS